MMGNRSSAIMVILVFGVLFSLLYASSTNDHVPTKPKLTESDAYAMVETDLQRRIPQLEKVRMYYRDALSPEDRQTPLSLIYIDPTDGTQYRIDGSDHNITGKFNCEFSNPDDAPPCLIQNEDVINAIRGRLVYYVDGGWGSSDGKGAPLYYYVDAETGKILWSNIGEDSYPELKQSD